MEFELKTTELRSDAKKILIKINVATILDVYGGPGYVPGDNKVSGTYELSGKFKLYSIKLGKSFIDNILITVLEMECSVIPISPGTCKNTL